MDFPRAGDLDGGVPVGSGPCGQVWRALDAGGRAWAVKRFHDGAVNAALLGQTAGRLSAAGWPAGVLPVVLAEYERSPVFQVTPWLADEGGPWQLQRRMEDLPGADSWRIVRGLAEALAAFHRAGVPHGNLKPGNVFFDENGRVVLTDWALGNMPDIQRLEFTDAYLYQAPEQLCDPSAYPGEAAFRWDVFSFGVLAFRVLTGRFPRCHETFAQLAPGADEAPARDIHTDLAKVAWRLESQPEVRWPAGAAGAKDAHRREWVTRCLALDPDARPESVVEVLRGFELIDEAAGAEALRDEMLDQRRHAEHRAGRAWGMAAVLALAAAGAGGWGWMNERRARDEKAEVYAARGAVKRTKDQSEQEKTEANQALAAAERERDLAVARLKATQANADRLFAWAIETGNRSLPPLDGREGRLARLERQFESFLRDHAEDPALAGERARAKLALAEIALSRGDAGRAAERLAEAERSWDGTVSAADSLRFATDRLWLALRWQVAGAAESKAAFVSARRALEALPRAELDADRVDELLAVLDFREAEGMTGPGEDGKALAQMARAIQSLDRLAGQRPDAAALPTELVRARGIESEIQENAGDPAAADEVRKQVAGQLAKLLETNPGDVTWRFELAGCEGALAESALLSGDAAAAGSWNARAVERLEALLSERPVDFEVMIRLGGQRGLAARLLRDRGQTDEATKAFDDGIRLVEAVLAAKPAHAAASFQLALLQWQKGTLLADADAARREQALALLTRAEERLRALEQPSTAGWPRVERVRRTRAYLLGDLGTLQARAANAAEAKRRFSEAAALWEALVKERPRRAEYREGLEWSRQRAQETQ